MHVKSRFISVHRETKEEVSDVPPPLLRRVRAHTLHGPGEKGLSATSPYADSSSAWAPD
jgi:hypothetical protein